MSSRPVSRRLRNLEARLISGPCTDEKWTIIQRHALELMSETDLELLEQACVLPDTGRTAEYTPNHHHDLARWEDARDRAFAESDERFTISQVDEMLTAVD